MEFNWLPAAILVVVAGIMYWREPRQFKIGVLGLLGALILVMQGVGLIFTAVERLEVLRGLVPGELSGAVLLFMIGLILVMTLTFAVMLVNNGMVMLRKERARPSNMMSLILGIAIICYVGVTILMLLIDQQMIFLFLVALGLPVGYLSFVLVAYLLYSALYRWRAQTLVSDADAVVVLGSKVINDQVTPLLAGRLEAGMALHSRLLSQGSREGGPEPVLVTSGGQGADETRAEGDVMGDYVLARGLDPAHLRIERESTTTKENIQFSIKLLEAEGIKVSRLGLATSDYHVFRAATLLRKLKVAGHAVGAPSARYYRPSALLREYFAILRDNIWITIIMVGLASVPTLLFVTFFFYF